MSEYKVNWANHTNLKSWKLIAEEKQKFYYDYVGNRKWEQYKSNDLCYLKLKIGYALFGPPLGVKDNNIEKIYEDPIQKKKIDYIMSAIKSININSEINIGIIYFIAALDGKYTEFPVIRVLKKREKERELCCFIDPVGYSYTSFEQFLYTNGMPSCIYCHPKNGFYTVNKDGQLELEYTYSPQGYSILAKVVYVLSVIGCAIIGYNPDYQKGKPYVIESIKKGDVNETKNHKIEVISDSSCSDLYAIQWTYLIAKNSQNFDRISNIMPKILEKGQVKNNWYTVLNILPDILKNTNEVNHTHTAQLFVTILFFYHTIVSCETLKELLSETLKYSSNNDAKTNLYCKQQELLQEESLLNKRNYEGTSILKRIDDMDKLLEEILYIKKLTKKDENENLISNVNVNKKENENELLMSNLLDVIKGVVYTDDDDIINNIVTNPCLGRDGADPETEEN